MNHKEMQELVNNLTSLEAQWAKDNPNRARGGRVAIAGFRYQFYSYLLYLIQEWISYDKDERCRIDRFLSDMERLSDIISISKNGIIIATQSKLTLRGSKLEDALDEFKTIHDTVLKICPSVVSKFKYRILCGKNEIKSFSTAIDNWKSKNEIASSNVPSFIENIEVEEESFPENRILVLITNTFKCPNPLSILHTWLGQLLECVKSPDLMNNFGKQVWNELNTLWRSCSNPTDSIYIWQDIDRPPEQVSVGSVLIGQRPQVHHLRKGYFSLRTEVYSDIEKSFLSLVDSIDYNTIEKIQMFWIGGRSGSGKSVALLYLLANLNEKGFGPIVWVGHKTSLLRSAVKFVIESEERSNTPIIAIDDPYVVGIDNNVSQHWEEVFAYLHSYQQDGNYRYMPIFIACGPTEQAHLFKCDFNEYFDFYIEELPQETTKENDELRNWYQKRTGKQPPEICDDNSLMVQLFFQWDKHQSINDFSIRLKDRLVQGDISKGIFNLVSKVLSLNRLYIGYPITAVKNNLTPEQKDILESLENDLHLGEREKNGIIGYWLLHAHLANALYLNWFETKHGSYLEYLKAAIIDSISFGENPNEKTAPLWAISRVIRQTTKDELCKRLDEKDAKEVLLFVFNYLQEIHIFTISMLPVWVEICALKPELYLTPSPIDLAINALNRNSIGETGLRLLCHKLLQHFTCFHYNKQQEIRNAIVELLICTTHWNEWVPVVKDAMVVLKDQRLYDLVLSVLYKDFNYNMTELLYVSIQKSPQDYKLISLAFEKLLSAPCTYYWVEIVRELLRNSKESLNENIISWLKLHSGKKYICFVLKDVLNVFYIQVRDIAVQWANQWYWLDYANFVLEPLIEHEGNNKQIINFCYQWILTAKNDKSYMIEKLLGSGSVTPEIISTIVTWLNEENTQNPSWLFAWEALYNVQIANILSFDLGMNWLRQNSKEHNAWPYIWNDLYRVNPKNKELHEMGIQWIIQTDNDHMLWQKILHYLIKAKPDDLKLKEMRENR